MKRMLVALLSITLIIILPASVFAAIYYDSGVWCNYLQNNYGGAKGVASDFHVKQRHPFDEYYVTIIDGYRSSDNAYTGFGWQIYDWYDEGQTNRFDCNLHVRWPNGTESYYDYPVNMAQNTWHRLKVDYINDGLNWGLYLDGNRFAYCQWPYYNSGTKARTQLEVRSYKDTVNGVYFYMGHAYNIWLKRTDSTWVQQGSIFNCTPGKGTDGGSSVNPFRNIIISNYWDWEAKI